MLKHYNINIEKLSSIPGRVRLCIEGLKGNSNLALHIENILQKLSNIQSISLNIIVICTKFYTFGTCRNYMRQITPIIIYTASK